MCNVSYDIISSGSKRGNAVVLENSILVDCGVSFRTLKQHYKNLKLVLLTHIHSDHFNKTAVRILAAERPTLRFACGAWLINELVNCGVSKQNIDVMDFDKLYNYGLFSVIPVPLVHDVPNCGWKIYLPTGKVIYATDTNNLNGITAKSYDLYLIEANYTDSEIQERIREKEANDEFVYEKRVLKTHLSKAKCDDFVYSNIAANGEYVYMHQHED